MTDRTNDSPNRPPDTEDAAAARRPHDALDEVRLDGLDEDGGTTIAGPQDRSDIANLRGGQHDAATGGSDLGASTGGGDTGAV
ncbi:MAG TPA: hypothetical protein VGO64_05480 [Candidatus Limnocylindrales bacterium]|nr:hypothetical protein [Candidatus Limnocylindrales bacterium]